MLLDNWNALAIGLAGYVKEFLPHARRGALTLGLPRGVGQVIGVFGNDGYAADARVKHEVAALRRRLQEATLAELGFGLSEDGHAWALLVGPGSTQWHTSSGEIPAKALVAFLDDAVWEAWRLACGLPLLETSAERVNPLRCPAPADLPTISETGAGVR
jgi:hypothetical protein